MAVFLFGIFFERGDFRHGNDAGFRAYIFDPPRPFPRTPPETAIGDATTLATIHHVNTITHTYNTILIGSLLEHSTESARNKSHVIIDRKTAIENLIT